MSLEVFYVTSSDFVTAAEGTEWSEVLASFDGDCVEAAGWYYWFGQPGCLPDCNAVGPFATSDEAVLDAEGGE